MAENEIESIVAGRLDKLFEPYVGAKADMLRIKFTQAITADAELKMQFDLSENVAIEEAFDDFKNLPDQIRQLLDNEK